MSKQFKFELLAYLTSVSLPTGLAMVILCFDSPEVVGCGVCLLIAASLSIFLLSWVIDEEMKAVRKQFSK